MGQMEILDFLRDKAAFYPSRGWTVKDVMKGLKNAGSCPHESAVRRSLSKLSANGFIVCETKGWERTFRYEEE